MIAKLTLELDERLIQDAEAYARANGKTLSELVAESLRGLRVVEQPPAPPAPPAQGPSRVDLLPDDPALSAAVKALYGENGEFDETKLSPNTRSLLGALRGSTLEESDYREYLVRKYS